MRLSLSILIFLCTFNLPVFSGDTELETQRINDFFEECFQEFPLDRLPIRRTNLFGEINGEWNDVSEKFETENLSIVIGQLARLRNEFDFETLDKQAKLSYRIFEYYAEQLIENYKWRHHGYVIHQMNGFDRAATRVLFNQHKIQSIQDAKDYISRLENLSGYFGQYTDRLHHQVNLGIIPPKFVFPYLMDTCENLIKGVPFENSDKPSVWLADFSKKVNALEELSKKERDALITVARRALLDSVQPSIETLLSVLKEIEQQATTEDGVWKLPHGEEYYNYQLRQMTTTDYTAEDIHQIGIREVARIHNEMRDIMTSVQFEGSLQDFFEFMRTDQFYLPNTDKGRETYLEMARKFNDGFSERLDELFITKPKAPLEIRRVEPFREQSAGKAFYSSGTPDGSRPGYFYANLKDMANMPTYQLEALVYHEGIPGHHMDISISQELEGIPTFRKYLRFTAHSEGWGLYCEFFPKEYGFYDDPYSDFGRLAMELWRAARLVVDSGIHYKRWTREEAIEYLVKNTPNPEGDCIHAIERYIVMPGQATAYKIGMLKILELRQKAKDQLGDDFDIREFHEVILTNGRLPLSILEELVDEWVESSQ